MRKQLLITLALVATPFAAQAETINLYGWQNHSWEFVDIDGGRSFDRIQSNAGNIGFSASVDTGMSGIKVNLQCEQFTYYNHFAGGTGWCNRNSKIGLSHPQAGEIMFATWLLPYNEAVAQWVDPFYDAGADSHTSIMGSVGANTIFYNTGDFDFQASASGPSTGFSGAEFNYAGAGYDTGFNRRQENIIQYWSPNWNGFVFRYAQTAGNRDESSYPAYGVGEVDPVIRSSSLAYTNGPLWLAFTWQDHEDWTAASVGQMDSSDAESYRLAARYIADLGDGMSIQISAMYEDLEYEFNGITSFDAAMGAFGYSNSLSYTPELPFTMDENSEAILRASETSEVAARLAGLLGATADADGVRILTGATSTLVMDPDSASGLRALPRIRVDANGVATIGGQEISRDDFGVIDYLAALERTDSSASNAILDTILSERQDAYSGHLRDVISAGANIKIEREAWMISGKVKFGGPLDFRFSYMDADDLEISCDRGCTDWDDTAADAWNVGLFYTMPAGTELRLTYSEVDNDDNGTYGQGISGTGLGSPGAEIEMFALGIVHWFD